MKNTAHSRSFLTGPVAAAVMTGLTYGAVVTAMFASLNNVAKAELINFDQFAVEITPKYTYSLDAEQLKQLPASAAGQQYSAQPALVSDDKAQQLHNQLQRNISAQLAKQLEKQFSVKLKAH